RFSLGRQWAMDLARWPGPQQLTLPRTPVPGPGFLEGLAAGLGERWGPGVTLRQWWPGTSPPSEAIVEAYRLGSERRWLSRGARE
ncbi:MAG: hypothetical protein QF464_07585, partial [Myxococcota bacterium]|nr:hypothetical protein [Myxococcota bacterium]